MRADEQNEMTFLQFLKILFCVLFGIGAFCFTTPIIWRFYSRIMDYGIMVSETIFG